MRTKKGDMVRVCYDGFGSGFDRLGPWLGRKLFRVVRVMNQHRILVHSCTGFRVLKSWVRCAEMKEKTQ